MNYLIRKNAQDVYMAMLSGVRKEVPAQLRRYINIIRLVGTQYKYDENTHEYTMTINFVPYESSFIDLLVTLASIKKDDKILNMYLRKFSYSSIYDSLKQEMENLVSTRVDDFDFNLPIFKKLILGTKVLNYDNNVFYQVNEMVKFLTNQYSFGQINKDLLSMIQKDMITKEDLKELEIINSTLAFVHRICYDEIKVQNYASLTRRYY